MKMKRCICCGEMKPLDEFYKHPKMKDGHLNKCIRCSVKYAQRYDEKKRKTNMIVQIINKSNHEIPEYQTELSAGMDIRANIKEPISIRPMERKLIPTGLFIALPKGYEAQIRPRSGLALKNGITVLNTPGTIDADYRGEVGVILVNLSDVPFIINDGDRIAQMVVAKYERVEWKPMETLDDSERGTEGFGHTGIK